MNSISLKAARVNAGIAQGEAARAVGVSRATMSRYEANPGCIPCGILKKLCELYSVPFDFIFCPNVD